MYNYFTGRVNRNGRYRMDQQHVEMMAKQPWEETLDFLTADMPPQEIDIKILANRYRTYIKEMQEYDLSVPAKGIRICAALLNMKTMAIYQPEEFKDDEEVIEENPMEFKEEDEGPELELGPELEMPVKQKPKRRMRLDELKEALDNALQVHDRREERQEMRAEMDEAFEFEEEDLTDKLDSLMDSIISFVGKDEDDESIEFDSLLEQKDREEKIEKFKHVLHLENDEKVRLIQDEWLGNLQVQPEEVN